MNSFEEAQKRARQRAEVTDNHGGPAWKPLQGFYAQHAARLGQQRSRIVPIIDAIREKAHGQGLTARDTFERAVFDVGKERMGERAGQPLKEGWVLAEKIGKLDWERASHGDIYSYIPLHGLLLSEEGDIHTYRAHMSPHYPKISGTDVWGRVRTDMRAPNTQADPINAAHEWIALPRASLQSVNEYESTIRSVSGVLTMEDLLASLALRQEVQVP